MLAALASGIGGDACRSSEAGRTRDAADAVIGKAAALLAARCTGWLIWPF